MTGPLSSVFAGPVSPLKTLGELESHNVKIHLKKDNELVGLYGMRKRFNLLGLHIDEPKEFNERMKNALQSSTRPQAP